mmetsp:Transcript_25499/g.60665  ORF Transcript_25499/g.60665 Transcript_25499/m.60665 type:complete len:205 (+) Transcript_25499:730-1344(+)
MRNPPTIWLTTVAAAASTALNSLQSRSSTSATVLTRNDTRTTLQGVKESFCASMAAWQTRVRRTAGAARARTSMYLAASSTTLSGVPVALIMATENILKPMSSAKPKTSAIDSASERDSLAFLAFPCFRSWTITLVVPTARALKIHCAELKTNVFGPRDAMSSVEENCPMKIVSSKVMSGSLKTILSAGSTNCSMIPVCFLLHC